MFNLSQIFQTKSREELFGISRALAPLILAALDTSLPRKPVIIAITGSLNSGKSAIWDDLRLHLFEKGGIFVKNKSRTFNGLDLRHYEFWAGERIGTNKPLRMFAGNVAAIETIRPDFLTVKSNRLLHKNPFGDNFADIFLYSAATRRFLPEEFATLFIDVTKNYGDQREDRSIQIEIPPQSPLFNIPAARRFLGFPTP